MGSAERLGQIPWKLYAFCTTRWVSQFVIKSVFAVQNILSDVWGPWTPGSAGGYCNWYCSTSIAVITSTADYLSFTRGHQRSGTSEVAAEWRSYWLVSQRSIVPPKKFLVVTTSEIRPIDVHIFSRGANLWSTTIDVVKTSACDVVTPSYRRPGYHVSHDVTSCRRPGPISNIMFYDVFTTSFHTTPIFTLQSYDFVTCFTCFTCSV